MKNVKQVIKLSCPFERIKSHNTIAEIALYKAVIMQLIVDASNISNDKKAMRRERRAKEWLFTNNDDFSNICAMANMETYSVVRIARAMISLHNDKPTNYSCHSREIRACRSKFIMRDLKLGMK